MEANTLDKKEHEEIIVLYGKSVDQMKPEEFEALHKQLRLKYHPDKFAHLGDDTVLEMAHEKFQRIETLGEKIRIYLKADHSKTTASVHLDDDLFDENARFATDRMLLEIVTRNKDLKYHLFGTYLRWLERGDAFKIPKTSAKIIIDENHRGSGIGFVETIRLYLAFGEEDSTSAIAQWLFHHLVQQADAIIISGERIPITLDGITHVIRRKSYLGLN